MATDPTPPRLVDTLPTDASALSTLLLREHDDRGGQLGARWWRILCDAYQSTGPFMRSVDAVNTRAGGPGNYDTGVTGTGTARETYLTPFRRESPEAFAARANRSAYTNHVAPVIDVYHGHFVRRRPERTTTDAAIAAWHADADGQGHDVGEWIAGVALRAQLNGWCAVLIDRPDSADPTVARRTAAATLDPGEVRDWQVGLDGRLDWVRIVSEWEETDPATGEEVEYLEASLWTRTEWARVRMVERNEQWEEVERAGGAHDLGRVPVAILRWQEQLTPRARYGLSQVQGVVSLALALYQNESELADHLANCNFSPLAVQSDDPNALANLVIGANNGLRYGTNEAAPSFISPGADVAMQYALRSEQLRAAIYTAAKMEPPGAKATGGDAASGIAKAYDFSQTDAGLQTFARQVERFEYECAAIVAAWAYPGDAAKVAAAVAATKVAYPQRFDAAGIRDDLGAMFAALDDKVRPQMPPAVLREARAGIARGLFPEATADVEAAFLAEIAAMYEREIVGAESTKPKVTELFAYDLEAGLIKLNDYLAAKGLAPRPDGDVTIIEWRIRNGLNPDGSLPASPADPVAAATAAMDALPAAPAGALTTATP